MATHLPRHLKTRDPQIVRMLKNAWPALPENLRTTSHNLAAIRVGCFAFPPLILLYAGQVFSSRTAQEFTHRLLSWDTLLILFGAVLAAATLILRAMHVAPRFLEAYTQLLPEHADDIMRMYAERGSADAFAPWIVGRPGRMARVMGRLARRFLPVP